MSKPPLLYRLGRDERTRHANRHRGRLVKVTEHPGRFAAQARVLVGELISVASSPAGSCAEIIVIRTGRQALDTAISLATVADIELYEVLPDPPARHLRRL
jgi:hypothetical protein